MKDIEMIEIKYIKNMEIEEPNEEKYSYKLELETKYNHFCKNPTCKNLLTLSKTKEHNYLCYECFNNVITLKKIQKIFQKAIKKKQERRRSDECKRDLRDLETSSSIPQVFDL